jgi:hypothetical protein
MLTPRNAGAACSQLSRTGCTATQGTCDESGNCVRTVLKDQTCIPDPPTPRCFSTTTGKCDASGQCIPAPEPPGTECQPFDPGKRGLCWTNTCGLVNGQYDCNSVEKDCPRVAAKDAYAADCNPQKCDPATGACYADPPDQPGTRACQAVVFQFPCCTGQVCKCAPGSPETENCLFRWCYGKTF